MPRLPFGTRTPEGRPGGAERRRGGQTDVVVDRVWQRLRKLSDRGAHLSLQWVPRHAGLPGKEMADEVARAAANLSQHGAPVNLQSARAMLQRHAHREWEERIQSTRYFQEVGPRRATRGSGSASHAETALRRPDSAPAIRHCRPDTDTASDSRTTQLARSVEARPRHWGTYYTTAPPRAV